MLGRHRGRLELVDIDDNEEAVTKLAAALARNDTVTDLIMRRPDASVLRLSAVALQSLAAALRVNATIICALPSNIERYRLSAERMSAYDLIQDLCQVCHLLTGLLLFTRLAS
jgi:hypothetical protein